MKNNKLLSIAIALFMTLLSSNGIAQQKADPLIVIGIVSDGTNILKGAEISITGDTIKVRSDVDGMYMIRVNSGQSLTYTYPEMKKRTIPVTEHSIINTILKPENNQCGATNYLEDAACFTTLAEKMAMSESLKRNSISLSCRRKARSEIPMVLIIDGAIAGKSQLLQIKNDALESVTFMEGSKACAVFGSDGVNGVVIVTTYATFSSIESPKTDFETYANNSLTFTKSIPLNKHLRSPLPTRALYPEIIR